MIRAARIKVGLLLTLVGAFVTIASLTAGDEAPVSGSFKGNGKEAKLAHVSASKGEPLSDKPTIVLVMTEKDHSKEKKPQNKALFGHFGSALIITVYQDGKIVGCEVAHAAHEKGAFSALGDITMKDFKLDGGKIQGKLATKGEVKAFGQTWEVNLKFQAKAP
ncbi:MAG: hypothetical protein HY040_09790 [Planctomycetes bacterium]|nr:hypothetical protein [Planctomycetota bacterium]